ncbi:MAG: hypothetical protein M3O01_04095 [Pseudomonadota bacterium]|nr:hypothetical protein [Pseudomonadota bacterium]
MKFAMTLVAVAALTTALGAQAQVTGSLGGGSGSFLSLSDGGLDGGSVATLSGGTVYTASQPSAAMPMGTVGSFLAAGSTAGPLATLSFAGTGVDYVSFLWGSPDTYNDLKVTTTGDVVTNFNTGGLMFAQSNGNQAFAQYVQFSATGGSKITSLSFTNAPQMNAFEVANFSITPVPEAQTYAMLLAGLGAVMFVGARRRD